MVSDSRMIRMIDACRHHRDATRVWNLIDHLPRNGDKYWVMLIRRRPEFFTDPTDVNSIRFTYDTDNPEGEDNYSKPAYMWKNHHPITLDAITKYMENLNNEGK